MNRDFSDLLAAFNAYDVDYLVVGAHALAAHGHVRATKDLEVWVRPDAENAKRVLQALSTFGAPLHDLTEADLTEPGLIFQIGGPQCASMCSQPSMEWTSRKPGPLGC